jgi:hypothetical protein
MDIAMSDDAAKTNFRSAIQEWQQKHKIEDKDPLIASLELLEMYFNYRCGNGPVKQPPSYTEFRQMLENAEKLLDGLAKHSGSLIHEIRSVPKLREESSKGRTVALITAVASTLVAGILIGKFLL